MKKIIIFIILVLASTSGCASYDYEGWKTIEIKDCGTIKIPEDWVCYEEDGLIYITDAEGNPIMIETNSYAGFRDEDETGEEESNKFYEKVQNIERLQDVGISNGAMYGVTVVSKEGEKSKKYYLQIVDYKVITFIVWDESVNFEFVKKMAYSFDDADSEDLTDSDG